MSPMFLFCACVWRLVLLGPEADAMLERADALAAEAKADAAAAMSGGAGGAGAPGAVPASRPPPGAAKALDAYDEILAKWPKDQKLVPRVRRRRASLLGGLGLVRDALKEHDLILEGRARRKDKARALYDGAQLLEKAGDLHGAERRLARAVEEVPDIVAVRASASLDRGRLLLRTGRPREGEACFRHVVDRCSEEEKTTIEAYDELALLAIAAGEDRRARAWLKACADRYAKRASRGDRFGEFLGRQLGAMKAPLKLAEADKPPARD